MAAQARTATNNKTVQEFAKTDGRPPYPFRTAISLLLLVGNLLVAAIYFHVINP